MVDCGRSDGGLPCPPSNPVPTYPTDSIVTGEGESHKELVAELVAVYETEGAYLREDYAE